MVLILSRDEHRLYLRRRIVLGEDFDFFLIHSRLNRGDARAGDGSVLADRLTISFRAKRDATRHSSQQSMKTPDFSLHRSLTSGSTNRVGYCPSTATAPPATATLAALPTVLTSVSTEMEFGAAASLRKTTTCKSDAVILSIMHAFQFAMRPSCCSVLGTVE